MLPEFVNAIITLNTTGSYELYSGKTPDGGRVVVSLEARRAEGYNSSYFKIKQTVVEPGMQAYVQKFDVPSLEIAHKLILMSIEEGHHGHNSGNRTINERAGESSSSNSYDNNDTTIPVVHAKSRPVNKIISSEPYRQPQPQQQSYSNAFAESEYPGGIDDGLEAFMGGGIKIANMRMPKKSPINGEEADKRRSAIESLLDSGF